jgi:hypothetical protein
VQRINETSFCGQGSCSTSEQEVDCSKIGANRYYRHSQCKAQQLVDDRSERGHQPEVSRYLDFGGVLTQAQRVRYQISLSCHHPSSTKFSPGEEFAERPSSHRWVCNSSSECGEISEGSRVVYLLETRRVQALKIRRRIVDCRYLENLRHLQLYSHSQPLFSRLPQRLLVDPTCAES